MKHVQGIDDQGTLMKRTLQLLKKDKRTLLDIFAETGIPFYWLRKFAAGEFKAPSVNRVQALYEKLSERKLPLKNL
jgi:hypothetical protein